MARAMKDSGIEWIGEIPQEWSICKIKNIANLYTGNSIKDEEKQNYDDCFEARPYIATKDVDATFYTINYENGMYIKLNDTSFKIAPANSTLMCIEGGSAGKKKAKLIRDVSFINKLCCFSPIECDGGYLFYFLCNPGFELEFQKSISGLIGGVSISMLKNFDIVLPIKHEQKKIAKYLDKKCAEIDLIIADTKKTIEEYKALKQSIISETVTKGLNPNAPMKDSGIEWIGEIPEDWKIIRIKNAFLLRNEKSFETDLSKVNLISLYTDKGVIQHSDIEETTGNKAVTAEGYKCVYKNDIVVNIILCWMGAIGVSNYKGVTSPAYDIYKPINNANSRYYHYLFRTNRFNGECYKYGRGIMMMRWRTYSSEFSAIKIPFPSVIEQKQIADYLDKKCLEIDKLIEAKEQLITELETYKKSVIFEYVTGKKEVE